MNKLKKILLYSVLALAGMTLATSCVKDGSRICDSYVQFIFDYNLLETDAFSKQATDVNIYLFDKDGTFLTMTREVAPASGFAEKAIFKLPAGYPQTEQIIGWSGLSNTDFNIPEMIPGVSKMEELKIALAAADGMEISTDFPPILHGYQSVEGGLGYHNELTKVYMKKNTNTVRIVMKALYDDFAVNAEDFVFDMQSVNGSYTCHNNCGGDGIKRKYIPHHRSNDPVRRAAIAEMSTLRLWDGKENTGTDKATLCITHNRTRASILPDDFILTDYLEMLKPEKYARYDLQEYLDREDEHGILILLQKTIEPGGEERYIAASIQPLDWVVRPQPEE